MEHDEHVALIKSGIAGRVWAELGSGRGAFTLALAEMLGPDCRIYSIDRDPSALRKQQERMQVRFPLIEVTYLHADFMLPLNLSPLDGVLMANALHFVPYAQQIGLLQRVKESLRPGGRLVIVEYDADRGNMWVPHPFRYERWEKMAAQAGFGKTRKLAYRSGGFLNGMYSAESVLSS
jgi:ubiquinone/menaquinone biosynthesis C-methylase UbiE